MTTYKMIQFARGDKFHEQVIIDKSRNNGHNMTHIIVSEQMATALQITNTFCEERLSQCDKMDINEQCLIYMAYLRNIFGGPDDLSDDLTPYIWTPLWEAISKEDRFGNIDNLLMILSMFLTSRKFVLECVEDQSRVEQLFEIFSMTDSMSTSILLIKIFRILAKNDSRLSEMIANFVLNNEKIATCIQHESGEIETQLFILAETLIKSTARHMPDSNDVQLQLLQQILQRFVSGKEISSLELGNILMQCILSLDVSILGPVIEEIMSVMQMIEELMTDRDLHALNLYAAFLCNYIEHVMTTSEDIGEVNAILETMTPWDIISTSLEIDVDITPVLQLLARLLLYKFDVFIRLMTFYNDQKQLLEILYNRLYRYGRASEKMFLMILIYVLAAILRCENTVSEEDLPEFCHICLALGDDTDEEMDIIANIAAGLSTAVMFTKEH